MNPTLFRFNTVGPKATRSEEHTSELQSHVNLVCRLLLEKKKLAGSHRRDCKRDLDSASQYTTRRERRARMSLDLAASVSHRVLGGRFLFFFNDTATTEIYTLSLHDALPISSAPRQTDNPVHRPAGPRSCDRARRRRPDRKSTRLNSSHWRISYAVFCLKKTGNWTRERVTTHRSHHKIPVFRPTPDGTALLPRCRRKANSDQRKAKSDQQFLH